CLARRALRLRRSAEGRPAIGASDAHGGISRRLLSNTVKPKSSSLLRESMKRLTLPLAVAMVLAAIYITLRIVASDLIGDRAFSYFWALAVAASSVVGVRLVNRLLFDVLFVKRRGRQAPALLRGLLSTGLYVAAFLLIYRTILDREIGLEILATSTV